MDSPPGPASLTDSGPPRITEPSFGVDGRSRRRRWILLALLVLVTGLIAGGSAYLGNYQPLRIGSFSGSGTFATPVVTDDPERPARGYRYHEGGATTFTMWLSNEGPLGVTITGVDRTEKDASGLLRVSGARLAFERVPLNYAAAAPFHAFSLGPGGSSRGIAVEVTFGNCERFSPNTYSVLVAVRIRYRVLGIPHAAWIDLPEGLAVRSPGSCPARRSP